MKKIILFAALLSAVTFQGCKKSDTTSTPVINSVNDIKVPAGFSWESSHHVAFKAAITDTRFGTAIHSIAVYDGNPYKGGNLLAQGSASTTSSFSSDIYISDQVTQVYVVKTSPDKSQIINTVNMQGSTANVSFSDVDLNIPQGRMAGNLGKITAVDCNSGCTNTITTSTSNLNVNSGDVICITGSGITVGFSNINGGAIRVCGQNVTLQNVSLNGPVTLIITANGSANISSINFNSSAATIENDGVLNGAFSDNGIFINNGIYNCSGEFNVNASAGALVNNGTMNIAGNFNDNTGATLTNNTTMNIAGTFTVNSGSTFVNNCTLIVSGNYNQYGRMKNYNLIKATGQTTVSPGVELSLYNSSMFEANNGITLNGTIAGYGNTSLFRITGSATVNVGAIITGAVQVATSSSISSSFLANGAALGNTLYIPTGICNSDGNGTPAIVDADGDGVSDNLDAYPNDATKAYNSYYPSSTGMATAAFEDQWPTKGDFDLNDLVISYRYQVVTNAANNVVQVIGTYALLATGGSQGNAFGVQFPIPSKTATDLTAGTLEAGQTNAVVILFTNMRSEMAQWNTVPGVTQSTPVKYAFTFNVTGGPSISTFGLSGYNPFIYTDRGREVHLWGHAPTSLASTALFGTADDNTNVSKSQYYVTKTGLPYAIEVPVTPFSYPTEGTDITKAYLHFSDWAAASGSSFTDWYSNVTTGYRNTAYIYTK